MSTKKYERVKLNTTEASSSVRSTASAATLPRGLASAITTGWLPPPLRQARPTTYAPLLRKNSGSAVSRASTGAGSLASSSRAMQGGVAAEVLVAAAEAVVVEEPGHEARGILPAAADADDRVEAGGQRLGGRGVHELDRRVHPLGREHAAGDRVEERLRELDVRAPGKPMCVDLVGRSPQGPLVEAVPQAVPQPGEGLGQAGPIEVEALGRVPLHREPVPGLEVRPRPRGERPEALAVRLEGVPDDGRAVGRCVHASA